MVDSGHGRRRRRRSPVVSPVLRPRLWAALLGAIAAAVLATPVYAEPAPPAAVPDSGARPTITGTLQLPGGTTPPTTDAPVGNLGNGPLASQVYAAETQVGMLGETLLQLRQERTDAQTQLTTADRELKLARDALAQAQVTADQAAADAFKAAAALPSAEFAEEIDGLSRLQRITRGEKVEGSTTAATGELARAQAAEQAAYQAYTTAEALLRGVETKFSNGETALRTAEAKLLTLRKDNEAQLLVLERQQEASEQQLGTQYLDGQSANGLAAHPRALAAVRYALAQLGDPYLWAAEGPDRFDCSGLMWAAYRSKGADYFDLPRVSRDQYYATRGRTVSRNALLPGDLLFFASGSSWTTIHHVAMYIGNGKMVHAPTTGDVVKISTVTWSRLYAATRVIGAVPAPSTTPKPPTTPKPSTSATPKPTGSATPTPTGSASPTPTGSATPTPTPTGSTSPSPTPSTEPSPSETPDATPSNSPTPSSSASNSPSPSRSSETSGSPSASGSRSPGSVD
ncbi:NlpC/P60 family protein [Micromonospora sp. 15K316]|uniref:C40 family peptidase n=1 Tax=Micromonospora sp. 15K316 TaxID=2530376 RepID=UPI001051BB8F|nr:C40 family peptidase [Micromonospora sp. 15K316]TDC26357.1 NlpC/P60 family protein [Micromonospora sp. 15K316]